ncbi:hypothetical protein AB0C69_41815, partial [Actinomadura sp. NPDC048032]|uniref:hypothetical protein n=1 Tax=Actinomadura sp. NPDC048032 TaxID=3155747 RepID=UPI0033F07C5A
APEPPVDYDIHTTAGKIADLLGRPAGTDRVRVDGSAGHGPGIRRRGARPRDGARPWTRRRHGRPRADPVSR